MVFYGISNYQKISTFPQHHGSSVTKTTSIAITNFSSYITNSDKICREITSMNTVLIGPEVIRNSIFEAITEEHGRRKFFKILGQRFVNRFYNGSEDLWKRGVKSIDAILICLSTTDSADLELINEEIHLCKNTSEQFLTFMVCCGMVRSEVNQVIDFAQDHNAETFDYSSLENIDLYLEQHLVIPRITVLAYEVKLALKIEEISRAASLQVATTSAPKASIINLGYRLLMSNMLKLKRKRPITTSQNHSDDQNTQL